MTIHFERTYLIAFFVLYVTAIAWNAVLHLVVLAPMNAAVLHLRRPDFESLMWLSFVVTAAILILFIWGYRRFARNGSVREGMLFGLYFALLAGVLVDLNQYMLYPIPLHVAAGWFAGGLVEFTLYGVLLSRLMLPKKSQK